MNTQEITINNVSIGDKFKTGKHMEAVIVDFIEKHSMTTNQIVGYICIAKAKGQASNHFEVPFATVVRNRI